jgi:hypothetical protein
MREKAADDRRIDVSVPEAKGGASQLVSSSIVIGQIERKKAVRGHCLFENRLCARH